MEEGSQTESVEPYDAPRDAPHEEIAQLETRIDELTAKIESSRKFVLAGGIAIVLGGLLLLPGFLYAVMSQPITLISALIAVISGIVVFGSNRSTAKEASAQLVFLRSRRSALIDRLELRVVGDHDGASVQR